jgi:hypothetical protein
MIRFHTVEATNNDTGDIGYVYLPDFRGDPLPAARECTVHLESEPRRLLSRAVRLAEVFTRQQEARRRLGQDCVAFAYAWESGQQLHGTRFYSAGGIKVLPSVLTDVSEGVMTPPKTDPGEIIFTENATNIADSPFASETHFLVHASTDDGPGAPSLYLSKFGTGPVILSTLWQNLDINPGQSIGRASGFRKIDDSITDPTGLVEVNYRVS